MWGRQKFVVSIWGHKLKKSLGTTDVLVVNNAKGVKWIFFNLRQANLVIVKVYSLHQSFKMIENFKYAVCLLYNQCNHLNQNIF